MQGKFRMTYPQSDGRWWFIKGTCKGSHKAVTSSCRCHLQVMPVPPDRQLLGIWPCRSIFSVRLWWSLQVSGLVTHHGSYCQVNLFEIPASWDCFFGCLFLLAFLHTWLYLNSGRSSQDKYPNEDSTKVTRNLQEKKQHESPPPHPTPQKKTTHKCTQRSVFTVITWQRLNESEILFLS